MDLLYFNGPRIDIPEYRDAFINSISERDADDVSTQYLIIEHETAPIISIGIPVDYLVPELLAFGKTEAEIISEGFVGKSYYNIHQAEE